MRCCSIDSVSFLEALATIPAALALGAAVLVFRWVTGG